MAESIPRPPGGAPPLSPQSAVKATAGLYLWAWLSFLTICTAARIAAPYALVIDVLANLSYLAAIPLVFTIIFAAVRGRWAATVTGIVVTGIALSPVIRAIEWVAPAGLAAAPQATVLFCNIHGDVAAVAPLLKAIEREQPDIVAIVEAEPPVVARLLATLESETLFPFRILPRPGMEWSHVVLSRHPIQPIKMHDADRRYRGLFTFHRACTIDLPIGRVIFSTEHLPSPRTTHAWRDGNHRIALIGEVIHEHFASLGHPVVIAGDFNSTPSGYRHRLLEEVAGLHADPLGAFAWGTWPSPLPQWIRLPLDRVWGTPEIHFHSRRILEHVGSDHRPIVVAFGLTK